MKSSLQVRLHPKPQIEIRYCVDAEMKLLAAAICIGTFNILAFGKQAA